MFAPTRLVLAFLAVLGAVSLLIFHLVDVVEAASVLFRLHFLLGGRRDHIIALEVVDVAVLGVELSLHLLDFLGHRCLSHPSLFL